MLKPSEAAAVQFASVSAHLTLPNANFKIV